MNFSNFFSKIVPTILTIIMVFGFLGLNNSPLKVNAAYAITPLKDLVINNCLFSIRTVVIGIYSTLDDCNPEYPNLETTKLTLNKRYLNFVSCFSPVARNQVTRGIVTDTPFTGSLCDEGRNISEGVYTIDLTDPNYNTVYLNHCSASRKESSDLGYFVPIKGNDLVRFYTNQTAYFNKANGGYYEFLSCGNDRSSTSTPRFELNNYRSIKSSDRTINQNELIIINCINYRSGGILSSFQTSSNNTKIDCFDNYFTGNIQATYPIEKTKLTLNKRYLNLVSCYSFNTKSQLTRGIVTDEPFTGNLCDGDKNYNEGVYTIDLANKKSKFITLSNCVNNAGYKDSLGEYPTVSYVSNNFINNNVDNIVRFSVSESTISKGCNDSSRTPANIDLYYVSNTFINTSSPQTPNPSTPSYPNLPNLLDSWSLQASSDFNSDGNVDVLWRNKVDGTLVIWYLNGKGNFLSGTNNPVAGDGVIVGVPVPFSTTFSVQAIGDIDGDGNKDILWTNKDGGSVVWYLDGQRKILSGDVLPYTLPDWDIVATVDTNNDKKDDIIFKNKKNNTVVVWQSSRILDNTNNANNNTTNNTTTKLKYNILGGSVLTTLEQGKTIYGAYQSQAQKGTNKYILQVVTTATGATSELLFDGFLKVG
jgi:hypothetical protein